MKRLLIAAAMIAATLPSARAQTPDYRGEVVTTEPVYAGVRAQVDFLPPGLHLRNEGGSDGLGLCVITSALMDGMTQQIPALRDGKQSDFWKEAKARPGGYYPEKLSRFLDEFRASMPGVRWISWEGVSTDLIEKYTSQGIPVASTMNTGALYGYQPIHHFISVIHLDKSLACIVDNNDPGKYHWMPRAEFDRRFVDGSEGWMFVWLYDKPTAGDPYLVSALLIVCSAGLVVFGVMQ